MDRPDRQLIAELIASAATGSKGGPTQLATTVRSDYFNATAVEWVRRWRPERAMVAQLPCRCPAARCEACN